MPKTTDKALPMHLGRRNELQSADTAQETCVKHEQYGELPKIAKAPSNGKNRIDAFSLISELYIVRNVHYGKARATTTTEMMSASNAQFNRDRFASQCCVETPSRRRWTYPRA